MGKTLSITAAVTGLGLLHVCGGGGPLGAGLACAKASPFLVRLGTDRVMSKS
jgi:hypothetical protein